MDSTLPVAAVSDPASAELPPNRASKPKDRRVERSSIEMSQHASHYATSGIMSPNRPCAKLVDLCARRPRKVRQFRREHGETTKHFRSRGGKAILREDTAHLAP